MAKSFFHKLTAPITTTVGDIYKSGKEFQVRGKLIFLLILILFPANLARRFIPSNAYVQGVLVDYLAPALYLTELLVLLLLASNTIQRLRNRSLGLKIASLLPLVILLPSVAVGSFSSISLFRLGEIFLWIGFGLWVARGVVWERDRRCLTKAFSWAVVWVSLLAITQFIIQRNVFGYIFLGEPVIYPSLGGAACTTFLGKEFLRAYGTFPHPNVLGGSLAVILPWILAEGLLLPAGLGIIALIVSFSRLSWVVFLFGFLALGISRVKGSSRLKLAIPAVAGLLLTVFLLLPDAADFSVTRRIELLQSAKEMFLNAPLAGIGLGLFTAKLPSFGVPSGPTLFLQPVHNILALAAAESGILALAAALIFLALALHRAWKTKQVLLLIALTQLAFLGFFDHYLYTLPQGLFLLSLTLGIVFSYSDGDGR